MSGCREVVRRRPVAIIETRPGQDWSHSQFCGRPAGPDGRCASHARAHARQYEDRTRERSMLRALAGRVRL